MTLRDDLFDLTLTGKTGLTLDLGPRVESWEPEISMVQAPSLRVTVGDADRRVRTSPVLDRQRDEVLDQGVLVRAGGVTWEVMGVDPQGLTVDLILEPRHIARARRAVGRRAFQAGAYTRTGALRTLLRSQHGVTLRAPGRGEPEPPPAVGAAGTPGAHEDTDLTVQGAPATQSQIGMASSALRRAATHRASARPVKALMEALIRESRLQTGAAVWHKDADSRGPLQIRDRTLADLRGRGHNLDSEDIEDAVDGFLIYGFTSSKGAIQVARENPTWTPAQIAQEVQGSRYPDRYGKWAAEADALIEAFDGGGSRPAGDTEAGQFGRGLEEGEEDQSTWDVGMQFAEDIRYAWFAQLDPVFVFADERELLRSQPVAIFRPDDPAIDFIDGGWDAGHGVDKLDISARVGDDLRTTPAGGVILVADAGASDGRYLVETWRQPSGQDVRAIVLRRARDPKRPSAVTAGSRAAAFTTEAGSPRSRVVAEAKKTLSTRTGFRRYQKTGGGPQNLTDPTPAVGRSDCSQWVAAIYSKAGLPSPGTYSGAQLANGKRTSTPRPGDLLVGSNHVEIYVGNLSDKPGYDTIGHGSPPIDYGRRADYPALVFVTFDFLDED